MESGPGIYTVKGDILPIQIIDSRRLSAEENLWLKDLANDLEPLEIQRITTEIYRQDKVSRACAYLAVIAKANYLAVEEAMKMSSEAKSLDDVFERTGLAAKWEARAEARAEARLEARAEAKAEARIKASLKGTEARVKESTATSIAKNMVNQGYSFEAVVSATQLDPEKVRPLYQNR